LVKLKPANGSAVKVTESDGDVFDPKLGETTTQLSTEQEPSVKRGCGEVELAVPAKALG
jgi:hypothetical protein